MLKRLISWLPKPKYVYKSSVTGRFVSKAFALANPETTYRERIA